MATAEWMYHRMLSHPGGPAKCYPAVLLSDPPQHLLVKSYLNDYLHFGNIQAAAIASDFKMVAIRYYRIEQLVAYRMENNQVRQRFIAWAVNLLRGKCDMYISLKVRVSVQLGAMEVWPAMNGT